MMFTNIELVEFCQNMLGAPYWYGASCVKATKTLLKTNNIRFSYEYPEERQEYFQHCIEEQEVVTDSIGLIKGFMWSNGGAVIINSRNNSNIYVNKINSNDCPDRSINGMFSYAVDCGAKWGEIDTLPEVPGLIITMNSRLAIYEGKGYGIECDKDKGCIRVKLKDDNWKFWYELPFINYTDKIIAKDPHQKEEELLLNGYAFALNNVLVREEPNEDAKFLKVIKKNAAIDTFNDSSSKWLHIKDDEMEGYTNAKYFMYFPNKPDVISSILPKSIDNKLKGTYVITKNISLRESPNPRARIYTNMEKELPVECTGGNENGWLHIYAEYRGKSYLGYANSKLLKKVK